MSDFQEPKRTLGDRLNFDKTGQMYKPEVADEKVKEQAKQLTFWEKFFAKTELVSKRTAWIVAIVGVFITSPITWILTKKDSMVESIKVQTKKEIADAEWKSRIDSSLKKVELLERKMEMMQREQEIFFREQNERSAVQDRQMDRIQNYILQKK